MRPGLMLMRESRAFEEWLTAPPPADPHPPAIRPVAATPRGWPLSPRVAQLLAIALGITAAWLA